MGILVIVLIVELSNLDNIVDTFHHTKSLMTSHKVFTDLLPNVGSNPDNIVHVYNYHSSFIPLDPFSTCRNKCVMTTGQQRYADKQVVVFLAHKLSKNPPRKPQGQVWILFTQEPPYKHIISLGAWNDVINWTMTYRRDSDFLVNYGHCQPSLTDHQVQSGSLFQLNGDVSTLTPTDHFGATHNKDGKSPLLSLNVERVNKTLGKTYMATSNCQDSSQRLTYTHALMKWTPVDIYGRCGQLICPRTNQCDKMFSSNYDFYLAFESAKCRDYITEKAYKVFSKHMHNIPVLRGPGYLYKSYLPPNSFINTDEFTSQKRLADFMTNVSNNRPIFSKYFEWQQKYNCIAGNSNIQRAFCSLCDRLHEQNYSTKYRRLYGDIRAWMFGNSHVTICSHMTYPWAIIIKYCIYGTSIVLLGLIGRCHLYRTKHEQNIVI